MKNWFKPRYKICYLTKNKVWPHKNSRLRNFFHIRSNIVLKRGWFKKYLAQRNMKWTVARRKMLPYFRKKKHFKYNYKNILFLKEQLKNFYGKLKEHHLRKIFTEIVTSRQLLKNNALGTFLEQRLDMVLFRTRMMPSIFACNQLISHQGVYVNNILIKYPNKRINVGDIISIKHDQWKIFYDYIHEKVIYRDFAHTLLKRRIKKKIDKLFEVI